MPAEILRSPVPVTGAVEGLLCRGTPVINAHGQRAVIVEAENPDPARLHELSRIRIDWSSPTALDIAIRWLMDRGHAVAWMRPLRYGGRVPAWDGLTEDEVAAILVSVSVRDVAAGRRPVWTVARRRQVRDLTPHYVDLLGNVWPERAALDDHCALLVPGGVMVPRG